MAARVQFTSGFSRRYTGGVREFTVEAKNERYDEKLPIKVTVGEELPAKGFDHEYDVVFFFEDRLCVGEGLTWWEHHSVAGAS